MDREQKERLDRIIDIYKEHTFAKGSSGTGYNEGLAKVISSFLISEEIKSFTEVFNKTCFR